MRMLCALLTLALAGAPAAYAAKPSEGTVSAAAPRADWTGELLGPSVATDLPYAATGGTHGTCTAPLCDTFSLTVSAGGRAPLKVAATATTAATNLSLEVVGPDGSTAFAGSLTASASKSITVPAAPDGEYTVHVSAGNLDATLEISYEAHAVLGDLVAGTCSALQRFEYEPGGAPLPAGGPANDPLYGSMFGHPQMRVAEAWARGGRGQGSTIAIVDSGIDLDHPDLVDNLVPGVDMLEGEAGDCALGPRDLTGHGTHVAGLAAASAGNGIGVAGVAPRARIMPVRVCHDTGQCPAAAVIKGIKWAADHGADVINLSLGADEPSKFPSDPDFLEDAVEYAVSRGAVVVASAGNSTWAFCGFPAADPGAICVAAVDKRGLPAAYSNLPADRDAQVDAVRAFGGTLAGGCDEQAISTAWPGAGTNACGRAYAGYSGTSMASPHVAGAAAIMRSFGIPAGQVIERMLATASNGDRYDPVMGYGIPNVDAATSGLTPVPEPPPAAPAPAPGPAAAAPRRRDVRSRACRRAQASLRVRTKRLRRARARGQRKFIKRHAGRRAAAQRQVRRHCR